MKYLLLLTLFGLIGSAHAATTDFDLAWSAQTYQPPAYRGHSLAAPGSTVRVAAILPDGADPARLDFRWFRDEQFLSSLSGPGKYFIDFRVGNLGASHRLKLRLLDSGGVLFGEQTIVVPVLAPILSLYQNNPLIGVDYAAAITDNLNLSQPEIRLWAEPFHFSQSDVAGGLNYLWQLNGEKVAPEPGNGQAITFAAPTGAAGENNISLAVTNNKNVFQTAAKSLKIQFGGGNTNLTF